MTFEDMMLATLKEHGLTSASIHVTKREDGVVQFTSYAHATINGQSVCAQASTDVDGATALAMAIKEVDLHRNPPAPIPSPGEAA